nr:hypothetical protein [uncultured bacterium]
MHFLGQDGENLAEHGDRHMRGQHAFSGVAAKCGLSPAKVGCPPCSDWVWRLFQF